MIENFECRNCFAILPLDIHGRCSACGSSSVISQEVVCVGEFQARDLASELQNCVVVARGNG